MPTRSNTPGVYKRLSDVPARQRLKNYASQYEGRDIWAEYYAEANGDPKHTKSRQRRWSRAMEARDTHPALPHPDDVKAWADGFADDSDTTKRTHAVMVLALFRWLLWHPDHPHTYNPLMFAYHEYDTVQELLDHGTTQTHEIYE